MLSKGIMKYTTVTTLMMGAVNAAAISDDILNNQLVIQSKGQSRMPPDNEIWWGDSQHGGYMKSIERFVDDVVGSAGHTLDHAMRGIEQMGQVIGRELGSLLDGLENNNDEDRRRHRSSNGRQCRGKTDNDMTIYKIIRQSKYTTKFAKLVEEFPDVKDRLNDMKEDYTLFVPTDKAFEDLPEHEKPSKEFLEKILLYHIVPGDHAAGRVMSLHTMPTCLSLRDLGHRSQRLRVSVGLFGMHINFYSKVVATNIEACNGYIHAIDHVLVPPPRQGHLIDALPGKFSTFSLAMEKTRLGEDLHRQSQHGGTVFVPTNYAFMKLGPRLNEFLFSAEGEPYLRALLRYHVIVNETLYSDRFYDNENDRRDNHRHNRDDESDDDDEDCRRGECRRHRDNRRHRDDDRSRDNDRNRDREGRRHRDHNRDDDNDDYEDERRRRDHSGNRNRHRGGRRDRHGSRDRDDRRRHDGHRDNDNDRDIMEINAYPGGNRHVEMRSELGDKRIAVDIRRWMGLISMTVNGWVRVSVQDGISQDGVVHVIESVLMPPKHDRYDENDPEDDYENDNMSVDELKDRLRRYTKGRDDKDLERNWLDFGDL